MKTIYLDYNATTPVYPAVVDAMLPFLKEEYGNPSSVYQLGQRARKAVEFARETMAGFIGAEDPSEIVFTSCATESNNMALKGIAGAYQSKGRRVVSSVIEHSSVRNVLNALSAAGRIDSVPIPVSADGLVEVGSLAEALTPDTVAVSVMAVNNEIGTIQPTERIGRTCREKNILFHTDAVQAAGKFKIDVNELNADLLSLSAHKFGGPKGAGVLYIRKGTRMEALLHGGSHEKNRRAGTENVAGIVGMAEAARQTEKNRQRENGRIESLRNRLEEKILASIPHTGVNGKRGRRVSNTANIRFDYCDSSALLMALDLKGVACSTGSACQTGSVEASHVLLAMGLPQEKAHGSLRFSLGPGNTEEDIERTVSILSDVTARLRENHPLWKEAANR